MKILVLDEEFPHPINTGKRIRSFNLYKKLVENFHIQYIGYGNDNSTATKALRSVGIELLSVPDQIPTKRGLIFYLKLLENLSSPLPYIVTSHYSKIYHNIIISALAKFKLDIVICEWTPYATNVEKFMGLKTLYQFIILNIEADICSDIISMKKIKYVAGMFMSSGVRFQYLSIGH